MNGWHKRPRFWAVLLLATALLALGGISFARRVTALEPLVGASWTRSSSGPVALEITPGTAAARAGLRPGDLLQSIDGSAIAHTLDADQIGWRSGSGESVTLEILRDGRPERLRLAPDWNPRTEPYIYLALVGLTFLLSAVFIALRWPSIRGGTVYTALAVCIFVHLTLSPTGRADTIDWVVGWGSDVAGALWPALLIHLGVALTRRTLPGRRLALAATYGVSSILIGIAYWISPAGLAAAYRFREPALAVESWVDRPAYLWMSVAAIFTIGLLAKSFSRSPSAMHRSQMRWLLWGLALGLGPFVLLYAGPWAVGAPELPEWARFLAVVPMLLVPATLTAALPRYRLYDFNVLLLRVVTEVTAVIFTFAVLSATIFLLRKGVGELIPLSRGTSRYIGLLTAALLYPQLRRWVKRGTERAFYKQRYSYRATLLDWARELNAETDLASLLGLMRTRVRETLGVADVEVLVRTDGGWFESLGGPDRSRSVRLGGDLVARLERESAIPVQEGTDELPWARYLFSMKVKGRLRAVLAVAEREGDEPLSMEDRALLGTLAAHAATSIEAARLVREVRQRADEVGRLHALQARILESSAVGLLLLDGKGSILAWNRALEEIYGLSRVEAMGCRLGEVFPMHVARRIEREGASGRRRIFRINMVVRDGRRLIVNIAVSPVGGSAAGDEGGLVVTFDDVTQRVELEAQVLQQERLASLGLLAAGVAHEINTPLTGISSFAQMLLEGETAPSRRDMLEKIEAQTRRASGITGSLLNLARPEETSLENFDLNQAVTEVLPLFEPQVRRGAVRLEADLCRTALPVRGNRGKLQQVLLNLLLNARDAVGEAGLITVATRRRGRFVVLEVADDGVGIAEEDLPRIFDPFFTTKDRGKGTGLGLSISFGIVNEHDGQIRVDSPAGGPTRFLVELPAAETAEALA